jgi:ankyrin repeat protein
MRRAFVRGWWGDTPVVRAANRGMLSRMQVFVRFHLETGGNFFDEAHMAEALCWAAASDEREIVKLLLSAGANPNSSERVKIYCPTLHAAMRDSNYETVELLIKAGLDLERRDARGWTYLHTAARRRDSPRVTRLLIEKGADIFAVDGEGQIAKEVLAELSVDTADQTGFDNFDQPEDTSVKEKETNCT